MNETDKAKMLALAFPKSGKGNLPPREQWSCHSKYHWENEPDLERWIDKATGIPCCASRSMTGAWCGYIALAKGHPLWGVSNLWRIAEPSGEINWEHGCNGFWIVGFDCAHSWNHMPVMDKDGVDGAYQQYVTLDEVKRDLTEMALAFSNVRFDYGNKDVIVYENPERKPGTDAELCTWVPPVPHHIGNVKVRDGRDGKKVATFTIYDEAKGGITTHFSVDIDGARRYLDEYYPRLGGEALDRALVQYWAENNLVRDHADSVLLAMGTTPEDNQTKGNENDN